MTNILTGRQPVLEALKSGNALEKVFILFGTHGSAIQQIRRLARQRGVPVGEVDKERFKSISDDPAAQGVAAVVGVKTYVDVEEILSVAKERGESPFLLVLDEIEDPHNLGALIRTAECAGVHGVIIPKHHSASVNQTVAKTSAGAALHLPVARVTNIVQTLESLKEAGCWIVGTDMAGDRRYDAVDLNGPIVIVVGSEGRGMRRLVKEKCDFLVTIPMYGRIGSLNASVAGALVLYEAARKRVKPGTQT
ncbi:MAG: 23S rRNA (guanosine(2251)-2'-O)-methyltransferase RlmB [Ignavibacteriales bacterium]|nr:23S rRNA (guanosine(2251)-2'-O)-methyltransferase RlmB [Ignavibacteriales bacterium]